MDEILQLSDALTSLETMVMFSNLKTTPKFEQEAELLNKLQNGFSDFSLITEDDINEFQSIGGKYQQCYIDLFHLLMEIYQTYGIKSLDECVDKINELWESKPSKNDELLKKVLSNISQFLKCEGHLRQIMSCVTKTLLKLYADMHSRGYIDDPNLSVGTSHEPLYDQLPIIKIPEVLDINLEIISNPKVKWYIYSNGSNAFLKLCQDYNKYSKDGDSILAKYYHDCIMGAIRSSCSLFISTFVSYGSFGSPLIVSKPLYFEIREGSVRTFTLPKEFLDEIDEYLSSEEGLANQRKLLLQVTEEINDHFPSAVKTEKQVKYDIMSEGILEYFESKIRQNI